ncbi:MAG: VOC family protein [Phycisphaeraceae bacterium]
MQIEHLAWNVAEPVAMAAWYVEHLGMRVVRATDAPVHARFLADAAGAVMVEIYRNEAAPIPDYAAMNPLVLHLAFASEDVDADCRRLDAAGASVVRPPYTVDGGDRLAMLRDPWGVALQLVRRAELML